MLFVKTERIYRFLFASCFICCALIGQLCDEVFAQDLTAPVISAPTFETDVQQGEVHITWRTDEPSTNGIEYGSTTAYGSKQFYHGFSHTHGVYIGGLTPGATYHYRLRAADASGNLTVSPDMTFVVPLTSPINTVVTISQTSEPVFTTSSLTVGWTTSAPARCYLRYRTASNAPRTWSAETQRGTQHSTTVYGLKKNTTYFYDLYCDNAYSATPERAFTTLPSPDNASPIISNIRISNIKDYGATISWDTNEMASGRVLYHMLLPLFDISSTQGTRFETPRTNHSITIYDNHSVWAGQLLYVQIQAVDNAGNITLSEPISFTALADTTPPPITSPSLRGIADSTVLISNDCPKEPGFYCAIIHWLSDEQSDQGVEYGMSPSYGLTAGSSEQIGNLDRTVVIPHLSPNTTYHFRIVSKDKHGNTARSSNMTFTVQGAPDTTAPVLSTPIVTTTANTATITWTTNERSDSEVEYTSSYNPAAPQYSNAVRDFNLTSAPSPTSLHSMTLSGLTPSTTYHYRVRSVDASINRATSSDFTFTTPSNDSTAPTVSITSPVNGSKHRVPVTFTASAFDNVGVAGITFKVDSDPTGSFVPCAGAPAPTSCSRSFTWGPGSSGYSEGSHTITVVARDAEGLLSSPSSVNVHFDTIRPQVTSISPSGTVNGAVTVRANISDGTGVGVSSVQFLIRGPGQSAFSNLGSPVTSSAPMTSAQTIWNTPATNGQYTLSAIALDAVGNQSISAPETVVTVNNTLADTQSPTVTLVSPAAASNLQGSVTLTASASDTGGSGLASVQFQIDGQNLGGRISCVQSSAATPAMCSTTWGPGMIRYANGSHTISVIAYDSTASGNPSASSTKSVVLDNAVPTVASVTVTGSPQGGFYRGPLVLNASVSDSGGSGVVGLQFLIDNQNFGPVVSCSGSCSKQWNPGDFRTTDGQHTVSAVAVDGSGNRSNPFNVFATLDNTRPQVTAISTTPTHTSPLSNTVTVNATVTDANSVSRVQFYATGSDGVKRSLGDGTLISPTSFGLSWATGTVSNGNYSLSAVAFDPAGNESLSGATLNVTVNNTLPDTQSPTVTLVAPLAGGNLKGSVMLTASASDTGGAGLASVQFRIDGQNLGGRIHCVQSTGTAPAVCSTTWGSGMIGYTNGSHTISVIAYDGTASGNPSVPSSRSVVLDNAIPTVASVTVSGGFQNGFYRGPLVLNANAADTGGSGVVGVQFLIDNQNFGPVVSCSGSCSKQWNPGDFRTTDGQHTVSAVAIDGSGNRSNSFNVFATLDNTRPQVTAISATPTHTSPLSNTVTLNATVTDATSVSRVQFYATGSDGVKRSLGDGTLISATSFRLSWATGTVPNGNYSLSAVAFDPAGNESLSGATLNVTVNNAGVNIPPLVNITTTPAFTNTSGPLRGVVQINVSATHGAAVTRLVIGRDNVILEDTNPGTTVVNRTISWDTKLVANRQYRLWATGYSAAGSSTPILDVIVDNTDTTLPDVRIVTPASGATVSGNAVRLVAEASDVESGILKVEFYDNGQLIAGSADTTAPYEFTWNTTAIYSGAHTITAKAYNRANPTLTRVSAPLSVTVNNSIAPTVSLTQPTPSSFVNASHAPVLMASASADATRVQFSYVFNANEIIVGTDTTPADGFRANWIVNSLADGAYVIKAIAFNSNNVASSPSTVSVTVDRTPPRITTFSARHTIVGPGGAYALRAEVTDGGGTGVNRIQFRLRAPGAPEFTDLGSPIVSSTPLTSLGRDSTSPTQPGVYTFSIIAYDAAGNQSVSSPTSTLTIENTTEPETITKSVCAHWSRSVPHSSYVFEHLNKTSQVMNVSTVVYDATGRVVGRTDFSLPGNAQFEVVLNKLQGFPTSGSGRVCSSYDGEQRALSAQLIHYARKESKESSALRFTSAEQASSGKKGLQYVHFNTYSLLGTKNAASLRLPLQNSVRISNFESTAQGGTFFLYDLNGALLHSAQVSLQALGQYEINVHELFPSRAGVVKWAPDNLNGRFGLRNFRLLKIQTTATQKYINAVVLEGAQAASDGIAIPFTTKGETSVIEISNVLSVATNATVVLYPKKGATPRTVTVPLNARATAHVTLNGLFKKQHTGFAIVYPSTAESLIANVFQYKLNGKRDVTMFYKLTSSSSTQSVFFSIYNINFKQRSELLLVNTSSTLLKVILDTKKANGSDGKSGITKKIPAHAAITVDLRLLAKTNKTNAGQISVRPERANALVGHLLRKGAGFVAPLLLE